jgi:hypothetical protein
VDDVLMTDKERWKKKVQPPDADSWAKQIHLMRVFDELIFNTDRNLGNILIKTGWSMRLIDHTRAFRAYKSLKNPKSLSRCDRKLAGNGRVSEQESDGRPDCPPRPPGEVV